MHGLSSLAVLWALALPVIAPEQHSAREPNECREPSHDLFVSYGSPSAPKLLKIYIDPLVPGSLELWLEARRIVGERGEELRLELIPTRGGQAQDPEADPVRLWFAAAAALGYTEQALRLLERHDWQRVAAQLRSREGREGLARELGADPKVLDTRMSGAAQACLVRLFERQSSELRARISGQRALVVGIVDRDGNEQINYVDNQLSELRTALDQHSTAEVFGAATDSGLSVHTLGAPSVGASNLRLDRTFPHTGVLVGGEALPHNLLIFVEDEDHGRLADWLAPAMAYRQQNPGQLSVQVIAGGIGRRATNLRRRLCAARTSGLEVEFLLYLAEGPAVRRLHEADLNEVLQPVADSDACSDSEELEPEPSGSSGSSDSSGSSGSEARRATDFGHPRGAWLDGRPVSPSDLQNLELRLRSELDRGIIDWLTTPDVLVAESFEFGF